RPVCIFFFHADDGIRDSHVTGVQTCALPIFLATRTLGTRPAHTADQLDEYAALVDGYSGLTNGSLSDFFNSSTFGVPPEEVASKIGRASCRERVEARGELG